MTREEIKQLWIDAYTTRRTANTANEYSAELEQIGREALKRAQIETRKHVAETISAVCDYRLNFGSGFDQPLMDLRNKAERLAYDYGDSAPDEHSSAPDIDRLGECAD